MQNGLDPRPSRWPQFPSELKSSALSATILGLRPLFCAPQGYRTQPKVSTLD